ncbi:MAG: type II and III secretion system protein family protein [Roseiarcus sp.]|jgi:pilus assembly protein CpaC
MAKFKIEARGMKNRRFARRSALSIGALIAFLALGPPAPALSGDAAAPSSLSAADGAVKSLQLGVGRSVIVDLPEDAAEIFVGEPKVANAIVRSARRIYISTLAPGQTTIFALAADNHTIARYEISVGRDVGSLKELFDAAIPGNDIHVRTVSESIILTGSVASAGDAAKAMDIAEGYLSQANNANGSSAAPSETTGAAAPAGTIASAASTTGPASTTRIASTGPQGKVINSLTIRGLDQVSLRVTISEIRREIVKQLGVNMTGVGSGPNQFTVDNPFSVNGTLSSTSATLGWVSGGKSLTATLAAFERQGVARTLAEPTVTAVSGESAKFLAGGTIPIPNGETCTATTGCQLTIIQQPYGVTLNFTPVVLSQGRIQLRIGTEVTDIDTSTQITIDNTSVPGFRTRKNETTVELPSGGSIASAGLISTKTQQAINGVPGLMNLPILGTLFRSRDYLRDETELLIVVTPYIVHAIDPGEVARPDANFAEASDPQTWLLGRVNRIYSSSGALQLMPGYSGKVGFITD